MSTGIFHNPTSLSHDTGEGHPERADRIRALLEMIKSSSMNESLEWNESPLAKESHLLNNHSARYIDSVKTECFMGGGHLDPDTVVSMDSWDSALHAVGGSLAAVDKVILGELKNAFCITRPPGHHARPGAAMGFCLFNNIAIAAKYAKSEYGLKKIFILDWDVHHGNGTQESFYADESVFFCSLHQLPLFPGTGNANETGQDKGKGFTLNLPITAGSNDPVYLDLFDQQVIPAIRKFNPELILLSAGFDAHKLDPLAQVNLSGEVFGEFTQKVMQVAEEVCNGKIVSLLEGGYSLEGLCEGTAAHLNTLIGK